MKHCKNNPAPWGAYGGKSRVLRALAAALAAAVCLSLPCRAEPGISASHAILMDVDSGQVLYERSADAESLIASTTKIMTGLLVCEQCDLSEKLKIPAQAVGVEGSSMYLKQNEVLSVEELLYGMLLQSGNDAAVALAVYCAGSVEQFVEQMNRKAQQLGLEHTHFANPNGLDSEENYGTARDLAELTRCALKNEDFARIVATKTATVAGRVLANHNKLLWRYEGAIGVKTGYTRSAGRILVSAAQRSGRTLIAVTINAPDDWNDHTALLDYGFSAYTCQTLAQTGRPVCTVPVLADTAKEATLIAQEDFSYWVLPQEQVSYRYAANAPIFAPLEKGAQAGTVTVLLDGRPIGTVPVCWGQTVLS